MVHMTYRNLDGKNEITNWSRHKGDSRPSIKDMRLIKVLQIDIDGEDRELVHKYLPNIPLCTHRSYTRYKGDFAWFIWDNL